MSMAEKVYVAVDPTTPEEAWGICADGTDPAWRKELAKTLSDWIKKGATVMLVDRDEGCAMLQRGLRDRPKAAVSAQGSLL